jgi:hypothetical protein
MNKQVKRWSRYSAASLAVDSEDAHGDIFLSALGQANLSGVNVLHQGLDTVKQLYSGLLRLSVLEEIERMYSDGFGECLTLGGVVWLVASGGASGYQYRLQNSDLGLIIFVKSRYAEKLDDASHLKIECSPHWLHPRDTGDMSKELDALASLLLDRLRPSGCAVHLCVDVHGWSPSSDFLDCLVTRARRIVSHDSAKMVYMNFDEVATTYNKGQSYLLGSASSVQMAVYRKDIQAKALDKLGFWQDVWRNMPNGDFNGRAYNEERAVWRVEFRFHHSVISDFGRGSASQMQHGGVFEEESWLHISGVAKHLQGLWLYGLDSFRLEAVEHGAGRYYSPFWQYLIDDVVFSEPMGDVMYKRKKKTPGVGNEKNLMLAVGNLLSCYARNDFSPDYAFKCLKNSGIYDDLYNYMDRRAYYRHQHFGEDDIFQFVCKGLQLRKLLGKAA